MEKTPKGLRVQIGIFGRRNSGKSTFVNAVTRQDVSVVSDVPGTTTDPVEKAMEMLPLGPVLLIDTAGIDDTGALGTKRVEKTRKIFDRADIAVIVTETKVFGSFELALVEEFMKRGTPLMVVFNKSDLGEPGEEIIDQLAKDAVPHITVSALEGTGMESFRDKLIEMLPDSFFTPASIVGDLIAPGELVMLVVPIDLEAPKGRLIMPQVQTIRDVLDNDAYCMVVKERELRDALSSCGKKPALVVTDSQAFLKVAADTPEDIPLTSFSILFARYKGDLQTFVEGARAIEDLKPGDKVLIAEACTHHPIGEDIGRVKIPRWLTQYVGGKLNFTLTQGHDFPEDISGYKLIIHCGGCTFNPRMLMSRIMMCRKLGIPITNYGIAISYSLGIFERALSPFKLNFPSSVA
ncbi:MAG: [FeFe] hydrogenase H-cluster maturation GTPase HydF [Victivallales bacterium]|nr:[FeFe] hydrogenase H-cluster maturation GTPase HydF [Victivallales bacterium]